MTYIDLALLDLTERFCHKFQVLTGRTNVWLAVQLTNVSIIVYFLWAGVYFWNRGLMVRIALGLFGTALLYGLTQTIFKVPIETYENNAYRRVAKGLRNPRRIREAQLRIPFLTLSCLLFGPILFAYLKFRVHTALLSYSLVVLTTVVLYLLACDPLPPRSPRLGWLGNRSRGAVPAHLAGSETPSGHSLAGLIYHGARYC